MLFEAAKIFVPRRLKRDILLLAVSFERAQAIDGLAPVTGCDGFGDGFAVYPSPPSTGSPPGAKGVPHLLCDGCYGTFQEVAYKDLFFHFSGLSVLCRHPVTTSFFTTSRSA